MPNIGILELVLICGIIGFVLLITAMIGGVGLGMARRIGRDDPRTLATPLEILKRRYARGEITQEQFEQMKKELA